jgi:hypothetical protein
VSQPLIADITIRLWIFCSAKVCVWMESNRSTWQPSSSILMFHYPLTDNWTFMRCPPPSSVPSKERRKILTICTYVPWRNWTAAWRRGYSFVLKCFFALSSLPHPACRTHLKAQQHLRLTRWRSKQWRSHVRTCVVNWPHRILKTPLYTSIYNVKNNIK